MMKALESLSSDGRKGWGKAVRAMLTRPGAVVDDLGGRVRDVMTSDVVTCAPSASLSDVARVMWERDCGVVPIVDASDCVVGVLTDRDLCMASFTQGRALTDITAGSVLSGSVYSCSPDDSISRCGELMRRHRVRRLVVLDADEALAGIVALADIGRFVLRRPAFDVRSRLFLASLAGALSRAWEDPPALTDRGSETAP